MTDRSPQAARPDRPAASPTRDQSLDPAHPAPVLDPESLDPSEEAPASAREPRGRRGRFGGRGLPGPLARLSRREPDPVRVSSEGVIKSGRLAGLTMSQAIFTLAWPTLCESVLNSTVGLVDTWIAAHVSQAATDAVAAAAYLQWFIGLIVMAIGVGATAMIARAIGAGRRAAARAALGQAVMAAAVGGVLTAILLALLTPSLAGLFSLTNEPKREFERFLWAYVAGVPFTTVLFACTSCARGAGDSLRPLLVMIIVNITNLAAAWTLAVRLNMGVAGIGLGTAIAHAVGAVVILGFHARGASGVVLRLRRLRPHAVTLYRLLRLGLANFFETFGMWVVNMLTMMMVGWMSAAAARAGSATSQGDAGGLLGAHIFAIRIEAFSFLPGFAIGMAAGALCGQYLGAGAPALARRAVLRCVTLAAGIMSVAGLLLLLLGPVVVPLLSQQPAHRALVPELLLITGLAQGPFAVAIVLRSALHGAGDLRAVMILTWISQWGLRLPLAYAISGVDVPLPAWLWRGPDGGPVVIDNPFPFDLGLSGLWIGLCIEIVIRAALFSLRFANGGWIKARV